MKPVYVPRNKRSRKEQPRLHGAFTGGFSAGHFNTVGTPQGWTPVSTVATTVADFMDDQDHNEWGGPSKLKESFQETASGNHQTDMIWQVQEPSRRIGHSLLAVLGWKPGGSTAYVPATTTRNDDEKAQFLSRRRLVQIRLAQKAVHIPQPKLDSAGLGYNPFERAPEFQAHRQARRKRAREQSSHVYRVSKLVQNDNDQSRVKQTKETDQEEQDPYISFETVQDFVGSRSVGGFALREDEDDAYDDDNVPGKGRLDPEAYDTVAYEHESEEEQDEYQKDSRSGANFGGALASWAASTMSTASGANGAAGETPPNRGKTSDGRPPLAGFVLGGGSDRPARFPGPDLPPLFVPKRHDFGQDHPMVFQAISRAVELETAEMRQRAAAQQALEAATVVPKVNHKATTTTTPAVPRQALPGAANFAGVSESLKSRFATAASTKGKELSRPVGLVQARSNRVMQEPANDGTTAAASKKVVTVTRVTIAFTPLPLLCKRFHVRPPLTQLAAATDTRSAEEVFFQDQVLARAQSAVPILLPTKKDQPDEEKEVQPLKNASVLAQRPPVSVYKSIYEPESETSLSDHEEPEEPPVAESLVASNEAAPVVESLVVRNAPLSHAHSASADDSSSQDSRRRKRERKQERKDRRKRKKSKKKRKKSSKRSRSP